MDNPEVKSQKKKSKEGFGDAKAPAKKGKSEGTISDSSSFSSIECEVNEETVLMDNPEVGSHKKKKKRKEGFGDAKAPSKKGKSEGTISDSSSFSSIEYDDENEEETVPMDNPEVESHKKKRKELSIASEESIIGFANAMRTIPIEDPQVKSRQKKRKEDFNFTDLELVDTSPAVNKSQQQHIIPVFKNYDTPVDPLVCPKGPLLFMHGLSFKVKSSDVENFFKDCGKILRVRFILSKYQSFEGNGYVEFESVEGIRKAIELNGKSINGRPVRLLLSSGWASAYLRYRSENYRQGLYVKPGDDCM